MAGTGTRRVKAVDLLAGLLGRAVTLYLRLCLVTTRWEAVGEAAIRADISRGAVIATAWHSRALLYPALLMRQGGRQVALHDPSPAGRFGAVIQGRFGLHPIPVSRKKPKRRASREILRALNAGNVIGIAADGPEGPAHRASSATVDWARVSGAPVHVFAWSVRRGLRLPTWDRMLFPLPFTRGCYGFRRWECAVPRKGGDGEALGRALDRELDAWQAEIDRRAGRTPGP